MDRRLDTARPTAPSGCPSGLEAAVEISSGADPDAFVETIDDQHQGLSLMITGAKCGGCISKIEGAMAALPGMETARLNLTTQKLTLVWKTGTVDPSAVIRTLEGLGYGARPFDIHRFKAEQDAHGKQLLVALGVAAFGMMNVMLLSISVWAGFSGEMDPTTRHLFHWISAAIALPCGLYAGRPFFSSAYQALRAGQANMDVPISLAICLALGMSVLETLRGAEHVYFDSALMLEFFLLIGRTLDHRLRAKARSAATDLLALQATSAQIVDKNGHSRSVPASMVSPGDHVLITPGERVPVDGRVLSGQSELDCALATGETTPVMVDTGHMVQAGVVNLTAPLTIEATAAVENSFLAEVAKLMETGEQAKSRYRRLADQAASFYVPVVHTLAAIAFLAWYFGVGVSLRDAVMVATALLIITCPCALGLAAPAVQIVASGRLFTSGILVKQGDALERMAQVDAVVFDKTGTLTLGTPDLINAHEIPADTLALAAQVARGSRHPLSRALVAVAGPGPVASDITDTPGAGLSATVDGHQVKLGKLDFVAPDQPAPADDQTELWVQVDNSPPVRFVFQDRLRPDAQDTIRALQAQNIHVELLSGDREGPVKAVAAALGIEHWQASITPEGKRDRLATLSAQGYHALMVGDGLNDAPALSAAHVSLSPASAADISQTAADMVFQHKSLGAVLTALQVSRRTRRHMMENFMFAALYNCVAVPIAMLGLVTPLIAAIAMSGSSLVVMLNALRLGIGHPSPKA